MAITVKLDDLLHDRRMTLTENKTMAILLLSIFVIPGVVLGAGVYSWWRRR